MTPDELLEALPDRGLTMDEALRFASALELEHLSRLTFEDDDGEVRVWTMLGLRRGHALMFCYTDEWSADVLASGLRDNEWHEAVSGTVSRVFGEDLEETETVVLEDGEVVDRY